MRSRHVVLCVSALSLLATASSAATIEQTLSVSIPDPYQWNNYDGFCVPPELVVCSQENVLTGVVFNLDRFEPGLGQLEAVTLSLEASASWEAAYTISEAFEWVVTPWVHASLSFEVWGDPGPIPGVVGFGGSAELPGCDNAAAGEYCELSWQESFYDEAQPEDLDSFIGSDELQVSLIADGDLLYDRHYPAGVPSIDATMTLTYHYVPEPSTGLLLALGLTLAARRRRRI